MKTKTNIMARIAAILIACSLLMSLAACGQAPAPTEAPSQSTAGTSADPTKTPSQSEADPTKAPSPGVVKAGNLIEGIEAEAVEGKAADETFLSSQYAFAARLLADSYKEDGSNCLVSPLSVVLALAMTANGAANETLKQMLDVIGSGITMEDLNAYLYQYVNNLPSSARAKLAVANSIWLNDKENFSVREDFLRKDVSWYHADVYKQPFNSSAVKEINGWVAKHTDNMIDQILEKLSKDDRMLLINAICFDAKWLSPYTEYAVGEENFFLSDGTVQTVDMMHSQEREYYSGEDYKGFAKYYEGGGYKFVAILPDKEIGLDEFITSLDGNKLSSILNGSTGTKVNTGLPKFSYDYSASLKERLQGMGMVNAFVDDTASPDFADFSLMSDTNPLYISDVIHKTHIEVTEAGTRAAAVTAVVVAEATAMPTEPPKEVILDRPFLYMIVDSETNLPIFIGTVNSVE
ncbi:MAG: serpin family protein [Lachnospiraceae bacterium]|nr:serpin family protein [Lachnospiraceae bacterium]